MWPKGPPPVSVRAAGGWSGARSSVEGTGCKEAREKMRKDEDAVADFKGCQVCPDISISHLIRWPPNQISNPPKNNCTPISFFPVDFGPREDLYGFACIIYMHLSFFYSYIYVHMDLYVHSAVVFVYYCVLADGRMHGWVDRWVGGRVGWWVGGCTRDVHVRMLWNSVSRRCPWSPTSTFPPSQRAWR